MLPFWHKWACRWRALKLLNCKALQIASLLNVLKLGSSCWDINREIEALFVYFYIMIKFDEFNFDLHLSIPWFQVFQFVQFTNEYVVSYRRSILWYFEILELDLKWKSILDVCIRIYCSTVAAIIIVFISLQNYCNSTHYNKILLKLVLSLQ